jgi:DNA-binding NarL/FixJ family response regulator
MAKRVRVLLANIPPLMRNLLLATIAKQPDVEVVGEVGEESEIMDAVEHAIPDFLLIPLGPTDARPVICDEVLRKHHDLRVVAIAPDRDAIAYYWVSPEIHYSLIEPGEGGLFRALRGKTDLVGR